jgi:hypothetical protein
VLEGQDGEGQKDRLAIYLKGLPQLIQGAAKVLSVLYSRLVGKKDRDGAGCQTGNGLIELKLNPEARRLYDPRGEIPASHLLTRPEFSRVLGQWWRLRHNTANVMPALVAGIHIHACFRRVYGWPGRARP